MECKVIDASELPQAKALWKQAFNDSDAYIQYNFNHNIRLENSLGLFDGKTLAAMLYMLPKTVICCDIEIETYFIAGVATKNAYRNRGLARRLMEEARKTLYKMEIPVVYLYPFNHDFYKKLGYHTISWMRRIALKPPSADMDPAYTVKWHNSASPPDTTAMQMLYDAFALTKKAYFKRNVSDFEALMHTMFVDDGRAMIIYKNGMPAGYVCYFINQGRFEATESVFLDESAAEEAIRRIGEVYKGDVLIDDGYAIPESVSEPYAMMQIVNLKQAKKLYEARDAQEVLDVETMILEQY